MHLTSHLQCPQSDVVLALVIVWLLKVRAEPLVAGEGEAVAGQHVQVRLADPRNLR